MPPNVQSSIWGLVERFVSRASPQFDQTTAPVRLDKYGEEFNVTLYPDLKSAGVEGSYYIARLGTPSAGITAPGTGIALSPATGVAFSDTQGFLTLFNGDAPNNPLSKDIILDFLMVIVTAVPTGTSLWRWSYALDTGNRGSAGTSMLALNANGNVGRTPSVAQLLAGQPTIAAATNSVRRLGENAVRASVGAVGDQIVVKFGAVDWPTGGAAINSTTASIITVGGPPIVVAPGQSLVVNEFATGRTAAVSGEVLVGYIER